MFIPPHTKRHALGTTMNTGSHPATRDSDSGFGPSPTNSQSPITIKTLFDGNSTGCFYNPSSTHYENGRRYHRYHAGKYVMPNDEREVDRLDLYHYVFVELLDGDLYTAPLENIGVRRVLDVGTGTGLWAAEMAERYPGAQVTANDLSRIQKPWGYPNLTFEVDDAENEWTYPKNYFDYIHFRSMGGCFQEWDNILRKAYDHMSPGGYIEIQGFGTDLFIGSPDTPTPVGPIITPFVRWWTTVTTASLKSSRPFQGTATLDQNLKRLGFTDVSVIIKTWPLTRWPEDPKLDRMGKFARRGMCEGLHSFASALLTRVEGWSPDRVQRLCDGAREQLMRDGNARYWCKTYFISGKKPQ